MFIFYLIFNNHINRLNVLKVGKYCVMKANTRLLSGAIMHNRSILLEHTLVLGGEIVENSTVWQGNNISYIYIYIFYLNIIIKVGQAAAINVAWMNIGILYLFLIVFI